MSMVHPKSEITMLQGHIWDPCYYLGTSGDLSEDVALRYIRMSRQRDSKAEKWLFGRLEDKGGRIDAVTEIGWSRTIVEQMPQMAAATGTMYFGSWIA